MSLAARLAGRAAVRAEEWRPRRFRLADPEQRREVARLLDDGRVARVEDSLPDQLSDWLKASSPGRDWSRAELARESSTALAGVPAEEFGAWVYYPWSGVLAHVLPEAEFRFLRSARNRNKITAAEQATLDGKTVAVAGLSVGLAVLLTLAQEGVGRRFRLADLDALGLSNLNRLRAGVPDLGVNKAVLAARQLFELDPYLEVEVFTAGVTTETIEAFLAPPLDLLVEACDDLAMKVRLREEARTRRLPVIMDTSDRGLIDVERFDLEAGRPLLHGLMEGLRAEDLAGLSTGEKVAVGLRILEPDRLSVELRASLAEIGQTIETWPQLASGVALGAGISADAARRILLGSFRSSGRFTVDLPDLVGDGGGVAVRSPEAVAAPPPPASPVPPRPAPGVGGPTVEEVRFLVSHAILAPSGGNSQPWRFEWKAGALLGYVDGERTHPLVDFRLGGCYTALGAAAENVAMAARSLGLAADIAACPDPAEPLLAFRAEFERRPAREPEPDLFSQIKLRVTNRRTGPPDPLTPSERSELTAAAASRGGSVRFLDDPAGLASIADLMGRCDRHLLFTPAGHRHTFGELRFTPAEAARTRDGLGLDALEVSAAERAALSVLADWRVMARLRSLDGGRVLERPARRAVAGSSAIALLESPGREPGAFVRGGRAVQRLWLTAHRLGLSIHPWTTLPYLLARVEEGGEGLDPDERAWFAGLVPGYRALFPRDPGRSEVLMFRVTRAGPPTARSWRRPTDEVFRIADQTRR